jgi:hypothetical protein
MGVYSCPACKKCFKNGVEVKITRNRRVYIDEMKLCPKDQKLFNDSIEGPEV